MLLLRVIMKSFQDEIDTFVTRLEKCFKQFLKQAKAVLRPTSAVELLHLSDSGEVDDDEEDDGGDGM